MTIDPIPLTRSPQREQPSKQTPRMKTNANKELLTSRGSHQQRLGPSRKRPPSIRWLGSVGRETRGGSERVEHAPEKRGRGGEGRERGEKPREDGEDGMQAERTS